MNKLKLGIFIPLLCILFINIHAQPTIEVEYPQMDSYGISRKLNIRIKIDSGYEIDPTCINLDPGELEIEFDSINQRLYYTRFHLFVSSIYGDGTNDTNIISSIFAGAKCQCIDYNDNSISFSGNVHIFV